MTANNRPEYFKAVLDSWKNVRGIWNMNICLEPSEHSREMNTIVREMCDERFIVTHNKEKLGVKDNPFHALDNLFKLGAPFVVLAEDDILVSNDIIEYFYWAAREYQHDETISTVCAFSNHGGADTNEVLLAPSFCSPLVWGTWKNRWDINLHRDWYSDERGWDYGLNFRTRERGERALFPLQSRSSHIGDYGGTHATPELSQSAR